MDSFFPKTRRPTNLLSNTSVSLKKLAPIASPQKQTTLLKQEPSSFASTPEQCIKTLPTTPQGAKLHRPRQPPPVRKKQKTQHAPQVSQQTAYRKLYDFIPKSDISLRRPTSLPVQTSNASIGNATLLSSPHKKLFGDLDSHQISSASQNNKSTVQSSLRNSPHKQITPTDAKLDRPKQAPPVKKKQQTLDELFANNRKQIELEKKARSPTKTRPLNFDNNSKVTNEQKNNDDTSSNHLCTPLATPLDKSKLTGKPDDKISNGPLRGVSASLLDIIRAKEAAAKAITPEQKRETELLGIAPLIVRIVPTVFTSSKKEILPYDKVVDKCVNGLKSDYTTSTIIECLDLMSKVAPDWVTTVSISRGRYMRINRGKYTIPELLAAICNYKRLC